SVQAGEIAYETEADFDFVVTHRLGAEGSGIRGGDPNGRNGIGGDGGGEALVEETGENHDGDIAGFAIGDAQASDEIAFDAHALEGGGENAAAAMHNKDFVTLLRECGDLPGQAAHGGVVFE